MFFCFSLYCCFLLQDVFKDLETEADEDYELEAAMQKHVAKGGKLKGKEPKAKKKKKEGEAEANVSDLSFSSMFWCLAFIYI